MTIGLYIWDEAGNLEISPETKITRVLGTVNTGTEPSAIAVPAFSGGTPFAAVTECAQSFRAPKLTISGTTLSWAWEALGTGQRAAAQVVYGIRL